MATRILIQEYGTSNPIKLSDSQIRAIQPFLTFISLRAGSRNGEFTIEASSWVGDIKIPGLMISISPKIGPQNLLELLLMGDGEAKPRDTDSIIHRDETFWDLLGNSLFAESIKLIHHGLERDYVEYEENLTYPSGQVLYGADFTANTPIRNGIFCRHSLYTENTRRNQILKWGMDTLAQLSGDLVSNRLLSASRLIQQVDPVNACPDFTLPSRTDSYFMAFYFITILKRFFSIEMGTYGTIASGYLLNMNDVFEGFVREQLRSRLKKMSFDVATKGRSNRYLCPGVRLEPDLVITDRQREPVVIADSKYKRDWDYQNSDTYQMLAYLEGYAPVDLAVVIFPTDHNELVKEGVWMPRHRRLLRIGIPKTGLLKGKFWDEAVAIILAHLSNREMLAS